MQFQGSMQKQGGAKQVENWNDKKTLAIKISSKELYLRLDLGSCISEQAEVYGHVDTVNLKSL